MAKPAAAEKIRGNELGCISAYAQFLQEENLPVVGGFFIQDVRKVELAPWKRMGAMGAYLNLEGSEGVNDSYLLEIPAGKSTKPQKHMFEELVFVVGGRGATTVWTDERKKQTFEWQEGSLFSPPLNATYQHFNGQGDQPVRLLGMTDAPTVMNLFHNQDFIFNCDFVFKDRYTGEDDFFSGKGKFLAERFWESNFIQDVRAFQLKDQSARGAGGTGIMLEIANNVMSAHISEFPVGTYKKAHRHGPGAHVIVLKGEGYSMMWPEGSNFKRYDWHEMSLFVPPEMWFHQHFNKGAESARYLALKPFTSRKYPGLKKQFGTSEDVKEGGGQIEYEDESPEIRKIFEAELAKIGAPSHMDEVLKGIRKKSA